MVIVNLLRRHVKRHSSQVDLLVAAKEICINKPSQGFEIDRRPVFCSKVRETDVGWIHRRKIGNGLSVSFTDLWHIFGYWAHHNGCLLGAPKQSPISTSLARVNSCSRQENLTTNDIENHQVICPHHCQPYHHAACYSK